MGLGFVEWKHLNVDCVKVYKAVIPSVSLKALSIRKTQYSAPAGAVSREKGQKRLEFGSLNMLEWISQGQRHHLQVELARCLYWFVRLRKVVCFNRLICWSHSCRRFGRTFMTCKTKEEGLVGGNGQTNAALVAMQCPKVIDTAATTGSLQWLLDASVSQCLVSWLKNLWSETLWNVVKTWTQVDPPVVQLPRLIYINILYDSYNHRSKCRCCSPIIAAAYRLKPTCNLEKTLKHLKAMIYIYMSPVSLV